MSKEGIIVSSLSGMAEDAVDILEDGTEHTRVVVVAEDSGTVTVELPDGTQAVVHSALDDDQTEMEGVAFQFEDGRIGYIYGDSLLQAVADSETETDPLPVKSEPQETQNPLYVHSPNGKLVCNYPNCEKSYSSINHLKTHQRGHTGTRPHECNICKKSFTTGYALKSHIRIHTGEKPYQCPEEQCGKSFKTSGDLQKHIRTHTGERPFKCQMCGKSFTTSNIRKVHMRVHTGEKPYECVYEGCGRKFASATNYRNHCRIHTGEKPYVCSVGNCGKRFTEYSSLYKHHMVHNQQKRYCCVHCGRFYRQLSTLAVHRKTVHNITHYEDGQFIWVAQDIQVGVIQEDQVENQECSSSVAKTVRIATDLDISKKDTQMLSGTILNSHFLEDGVEVSNVDLSGDTIIQDDRGTALTSLEIDDSSNGSILVLTDPSQLAALQLAVAGSSAENSAEDGVKVISLDDFTSVTESTISKGMKDGSVLKHDNKSIIFVREVDQKIKGDVC